MAEIFNWASCHAVELSLVQFTHCGITTHPPPQKLTSLVCFQVKLWYDKVGHQLIVTVLGAKDLPSREDGRPRNPYVKIYFLPDRR